MKDKNKKPSKRRRNRKIKTTLMTVTLMGALVVGSIMAYLIDVDSKDTEFQFSGKNTIAISIVEEDGVTGTQQNVAPNVTYAKDPAIQNDGTASAYVFMQVEIPTANVETVSATGAKIAAAETELFTYEVADASGWVQLGDSFEKTVTDGADEEKYIVYTYVWGTEDACSTLATKATTATLFDEVTVVNYIGGNTINGSAKDIVVTGYAIQTTGLDSTDPEEVWPLLATQAGAATAKATE